MRHLLVSRTKFYGDADVVPCPLDRAVAWTSTCFKDAIGSQRLHRIRRRASAGPVSERKPGCARDGPHLGRAPCWILQLGRGLQPWKRYSLGCFWCGQYVMDTLAST